MPDSSSTATEPKRCQEGKRQRLLRGRRGVLSQAFGLTKAVKAPCKVPAAFKVSLLRSLRVARVRQGSIGSLLSLLKLKGVPVRSHRTDSEVSPSSPV
eukprot:5445343-Amphidinium_carterae.1